MQKDDKQINAFFGKDIDFEGKMTFTGTVRIDGSFKGEIRSEGTLVVGEGALVEADVTASRLIVNGEVRGSVAATSGIEIAAKGRIMGDIQTPKLKMEEGALLDGRCTMAGDKEGPPSKRFTSISGREGQEKQEKRDTSKKSL